MSDPKRKVEVIVLDDSDEDSSAPATAKKAKQDVKPAISGSPLPQPSRAELEAERLARAHARSAGPTAPKAAYTFRPAPGPARAVTINDVEVSSPSPAATGSRPRPEASGPREATLASVGGSQSSPPRSDKSNQRFWKGAFKRVPNRYVPDGDSLSISDIVGPPDRTDLVKAIASSFSNDLGWLLPNFGFDTDLTLLLPSPEKGKPAQGPLPLHPQFPRAQVVFPGMKGMYGSMHVKCIVTFCDNYCRIAIPTANLIEYDWSTMDNAIYIHDFPRLPAYADKNPLLNPTHTSFSLPLLKLLIALGVPNAKTGPFRDYDFSSSSEVCSVPTYQGTHEGWDAMNKAGGIAGLASAVASLGFEPGGRWRFEATGSSLGNSKPSWLSAMIAAMSGVHPQEWRFSKQQTAPVDRQFAVPTALDVRAARSTLKIVFPTQAEVMRSHGGPGGGGTLFCQPKVWNDPLFPRHLFHQGRSKRIGVLAHTKQIIALHEPADEEGGQHAGYLYQGSHNFTQSAWGQLQHPRGPQLQAYNWELGVLVRFEAESKPALEAKASELAQFQRPLLPYAPTDVAWQQSLFN